MTTFNFPSIFLPLVGLVFSALAMASLYHQDSKKNQDYLNPSKPNHKHFFET